MEVLQDPPQSSAFTSLADHQSQTPASFYEGPPVLHYHSPNCKILIQAHDLAGSSALASLAPPDAPATNGHAVANGDSAAEEEEGADHEVSIGGVDVWVTSQKLLLWSQASSSGVSIPYPAISLHAIQRLPLPEAASTQSGLYMQLVTSSASETNPDEDDDEDLDTISLTLIPTASAPAATAAAQVIAQPEEEEDGETEALAPSERRERSPTQALFEALSACSNLHPDPVSGPQGDGQRQLEGSALFAAGLIQPGDREGGLPPPMPGSGGWITAENVGEYFDEEGNWIGGGAEDGVEGMGEELGPGAGTVRARREEEDVADLDGDEVGEGEETKWRRTS